MFGTEFKIEVFFKRKPGELYPKVIRPYGFYYQKNGTLVLVGDIPSKSVIQTKHDLKDVRTISINPKD